MGANGMIGEFLCCFCRKQVEIADGYLELDVLRPVQGDAGASKQRLGAHARCLRDRVSPTVPLEVVADGDVS